MTTSELTNEQASGMNPHLLGMFLSVSQHLLAQQHGAKPTEPKPEAVQRPVSFEVGRFVFLHEQKVKVEEGVTKLLVAEIYDFAYRPKDMWRPNPWLHAAYTASLVLGIPVGLRAVWVEHTRVELLKVTWVEKWLNQNIASICPYFCPGSYNG